MPTNSTSIQSPNWLDRTKELLNSNATAWLEDMDKVKAPSKPTDPTVDIQDTRTTQPVTGKAINPNTDLKSGSYDKSLIQDLNVAANRFGVDPYHAIAVGLQETNLGKNDPDGNIGHVLDYDLVNSGLDEQTISSMTPQQKQANLLAYAMKDKADYADKLGYTTPVMKLQSYNGFGKLFSDSEKGYYGGERTHYYGVDVTKEPLDLSKNPAYGKTILSLADMLKQNKGIKDIVEPYNTEQPKQELTSGSYNIGTTGSITTK